MKSLLHIFCWLLFLCLAQISSHAQTGEWEEIDVQEPTPGDWIGWRSMDAADAGHVATFGNRTNMGTYIRATADSGRTWQMIWQDSVITDFDAVPPIIIYPLRVFDLAMPGPNHIVAVGDSGTVWTTFDFGKTWKTTRLGDTTLHLLCVSFCGSLFGVTLQNLPRKRWWTTEDGGITWTERLDVDTTFIPEGKSLDLLRVHAPEQWYVHVPGGSNELIAVSTDAGRTWLADSVVDAIDLFVLDSMYAWTAGTEFFDPTGSSELGNDVVIRTTNGGNDWETLFRDYLPAEPHFGSRAVAFADREQGFVTGRSNRIFRTTDGGLNWVKANDGFSELEMFAMLDVVYPAPDIAYAISVRGRIFRWTPKTTGVEEAASMDGREIEQRLVEIVPGSSYALRLSLGVPQEITVDLFDLSGRRIRQLAAARKFEVGNHDIVLDASSLLSGPYLLVTRSGDITLTTRLTITR